MAVVCDLLTDCSGEEHHVPIPAYGKAVAEFPLQWAGSNFLSVGFVGEASGRNAPCVWSSTIECDTPCLT